MVLNTKFALLEQNFSTCFDKPEVAWFIYL